MSDIQIAAENHRPLLLQIFQIRKKCILPFHPVRKPGQLILGIRRIDSDQIKLRILQSDHTPFSVVLRNTDPIRDGQRFLLCKNCSSGISLFLGVIPVLIIARKIQLDLSLLQFCLLDAENICVGFPEVLQKAFVHAGAQSIYVP